MKALILNSGLGKRMGKYTESSPKCMVPLLNDETIVERQLRMLERIDVKDVVMTTGPYADLLESYIESLGLSVNIRYVNNPKYNDTNYIYSIYLAKEYLDDEIVLMHGDLVFEEEVLENIVKSSHSCMTVSSVLELPEKDFKAVLKEDKIRAIGIEFMADSVAAQPLYHFTREEWRVWLDEIEKFCENGNVSCYAENAFNQVANQMELQPYDYKNLLCMEVDKEEDLLVVRKML